MTELNINLKKYNNYILNWSTKIKCIVIVSDKVI